ncbi:MAG: FtsQ-type POTRA domain-containing protein [Elusimicrobia bacterium]|nr:FtsQ-type POTRA domain-containing protein [Candidatus Liberimonas magnetica]
MKRKPIKIKYRQPPVVLRSNFNPARSFRVVKALKFLVLLGLLTVAAFWGYKSIYYFVFDSGIFTINKIDIKGLENITKSEIMALVPFRVGDNMFKVWLSTVENGLEKNRPELKDVSISRRWKAIKISLEERKPIAYFVVNNQKIGIDSENKPFSLRGHWASDTEMKLPLVLTDDASGREKIIEFIAMVRAENEDIYKKIEYLNVEPIDSIVLKLRNGYKIIWGPADKNALKRKLNKLFQVQKDSEKRFIKIDYINISYFDDGRIVVKPLKQ